MEIEARGGFEQIPWGSAENRLEGLCRSQLTGESQGSMVAMGTASILKEGGYKNGYNRLIFVISAYSFLLYIVDFTGS
jgi:hypothetical protein